MVAKAATTFKEHGATRHPEAWGDDLRDGKPADFKMAVKARERFRVRPLVLPSRGPHLAAAKYRYRQDKTEGEQPFGQWRRIIRCEVRRALGPAVKGAATFWTDRDCGCRCEGMPPRGRPCYAVRSTIGRGSND